MSLTFVINSLPHDNYFCICEDFFPKVDCFILDYIIVIPNTILGSLGKKHGITTKQKEEIAVRVVML